MHLISITFIALSLICAFWAFGIAEKFSVRKMQSGENPQPVALLESHIEQTAHADLQSEVDLPQESTSVSRTIATVERPQPSQKSEKSRLLELESKEFRLEMRGTTLVSHSTISKDAVLSVKMRPVSGTNLEEFSVSDAKLVLGSTAMQLKILTVKIINNDVVMTMMSGSAGT